MPKREVTVVPGTNVGRDAGVFQERGPRGGMRDNFATIPEQHKAPPTSKPDSEWVRMIRIEEELGAAARFTGRAALARLMPKD